MLGAPDPDAAQESLLGMAVEIKPLRRKNHRPNRVGLSYYCSCCHPFGVLGLHFTGNVLLLLNGCCSTYELT